MGEFISDGIELSPAPKWDLVVLTARNAGQKQLFELELRRLRLAERNFCAQIIVLEDSPRNAKIGSGGATLNALLFLYKNFGGESFFAHNRVLLLHSGGLSQRILHVALTGKAFMLMPDGHTLLEHKLLSYRLVGSVSQFPPAVFVPFDSELFLMAHQSTIEVAEQHGVYLLGERQPKRPKSGGEDSNCSKEGKTDFCHSLKRVLQKPRREEIRRVNAILEERSETGEDHRIGSPKAENGWCSIERAVLLSRLPRPEDVPDLRKWQLALWDLMHCKKAHLLDLGPQSFFHFGTSNEFLRNSQIENVLYSMVEDPKKVSGNSLLEWCDLNGNCEVGDRCILSGLAYDGHLPLQIFDGICATTFPIELFRDGDAAATSFVTVAFHRDDDIKRSSEDSLIWFGHRLDVSLPASSLWNAPLFSTHPNPGESLRATLDTIARLGQNGQQKSDQSTLHTGGTQLLSVSQVLQKVDAKKVLRMREKFIKKY
uniref:L-fucokinase domain-containing protein n=1 Tax=Globodera rostochiensis TaxID=31243 RepID=A0A914H395_GLORO